MPYIEIKRGYKVLPENNIRFGIRITNASEFAISDVEVILDYTESLFKLESESRQKLGNLPPLGTRTAEFILKPLGCVHNVNIEALISYRDPKWDKHVETMRPKEVHCVCPFLKGKKMQKAEFLELSGRGHSAETGLNLTGVDVERLTSFLVQTCKNRHYKVDELSIDGGKMLYLASESIGEKAYYLLTALIKEDGELTQVMLKAVSDKPYGLNGFLNETMADLRHVVETVRSAREIGVIKKEQVINIIDSVVQKSTFGGEGVADVHIEGSVVHGTEFKGGDEQKRLEEERKRKEEEEWQRKVKEAQDKLAKEGNSIGMKFTHIPAGEFMMGSDEFSSEQPVHKVTISKPFYLGTYPVTQREWKAVMGDNPSHFNGDDLPVEKVSWDNVQEFIKKLNEKEGTDKYCLPSEAEWEYACRAGTTTRYCFGDVKLELGQYVWYAGFKTHPVGQKKPNPWGLYDMHGNVWEWVQDSWYGDYNGAPTDGSAWESFGSSYRVSRGGGWYDGTRECRSAKRDPDRPGLRFRGLGFRLLQKL